MKVRSVKTNYLLNMVRAGAYALITLLAMPYVNKILGPENVGKVEYVNTLITFLVLFSGLGIPLYGIREIAKSRDDKNLRDRITVELLLILSATSFLAYVVLFGILYQLAFFAGYRDLILLMSVIILLTNTGAEWYFQGMEDQLYITVRYVLIRIVSLVVLFVAVKSQDDYLLYAFTIVLTTCGSNIFNIYYLSKNIDFKAIRLSGLELKRHFKPILTIFVAAASVNIYILLDSFLIAYIAGDEYLGYYSVSNKLIRFIVTFITIIGMVLLPRLSGLYTKNSALYRKYLKKAFTFMMMMAIPSSIIFFVFSAHIVSLFAGSQFQPSILTMKILSPLCIIIAVAYFIGYLVLYTQNDEIIYTRAVMISAAFSIVSNLYLIHLYQQNGAAVVAVTSELLAILIMIYFAKDQLKDLQLLDFNFAKILGVAAAVFVISMGLDNWVKVESNVGEILLILTPYFFFYMILIVLKEDVTTELISFGRNKIKKPKSV